MSSGRDREWEFTVEGSVFEILRNFGSLGMAIAVVGGAGWAIWKKVLEPQQKRERQVREQHMEKERQVREQHMDTLKELNEQNEKFTLEHINIEKENLKVLQELVIGARTHNGKMAEEHKRLESEFRRGRE